MSAHPTFATLGAVAGMLLVWVAGCSRSHDASDGGPTEDAASDATADSPEVPFEDASELPVVTVGGEVSESDPSVVVGAEPAAYECLGSTTAPAGGELVSVRLRFVVLFDELAPVGEFDDVCVVPYLDDRVPARDDCGTLRTDYGTVRFDAPSSSWISARVFARDAGRAAEPPVDSVYRHLRIPEEGGEVEAYQFTETYRSFIHHVFGRTGVEGSAFRQSRDCTDAPTFGMVIRVATAEGEYVAEAGEEPGPHYDYFSLHYPWTHIDGRCIALDIPVREPGEQIFVEAWGRTEEDGPVRLLGCETTRLYPDGAASVDLGPLRADGPDCPGLDL